MRIGLLGMALVAGTMPAIAQDDSNIRGEVVVTGQRASANYLSDEQTVVGLRRPADSAIQPARAAGNNIVGEGTTANGTKSRKKLWIAVGVIAVAAIVGGVIASGGDDAAPRRVSGSGLS